MLQSMGSQRVEHGLETEQLQQKIYQFCLLKELAFSFVHLYYCFVSISFISALIFMIMSLLLTLGLLILFCLLALHIRLVCLLEIFLVL